MIKSVEVTGRSEDEAIASALEEIGLTRDDVSVEIIERAKSGFLGLKSTPAIVRITYEAKDDRAGHVEGFLSGLFERMGVDIMMDVQEEGGSLNVTLSGEENGRAHV